jgi:hypothetical protein
MNKQEKPVLPPAECDLQQLSAKSLNEVIARSRVLLMRDNSPEIEKSGSKWYLDGKDYKSKKDAQIAFIIARGLPVYPGDFDAPPCEDAANDCGQHGGLIVGIDPSFANCGIVGYTNGNKLAFNATLRLIDVADAIKHIVSNGALCGVVVEDPNLQAATYKASSARSAGYNAKIGQNAAGAMYAASYVIELLQRYGIAYVQVNPTRRTMVKGIETPSYMHYLPTKCSDSYFCKYANCDDKGLTEHERDAATLIVNRTWSDIVSRKNIDNQRKVWGR